jgi:hypothetical protein
VTASPPAPAHELSTTRGVGDGPRDDLTRYATPLTGAYYAVPSVEALRWFTTGPG